MKVLQNWDAICGCMSAVYTNNTSKKQMVVDLMTLSKAIVGPLLKLCGLLKCQKRVRPPAIRAVQEACVEIFSAWKRTDWPSHLVFLKLHHIVVHSPMFLSNWEMYGRGSEEGFEASHPIIESIKGLCGSMPKAKDRIQVECRHLMACRDPEVAATLAIFYATDKNARGRYNTSNRTRAQDDTTVESHTLEYLGGDFYKTLAGNFLHERWRDVYELCEHGRAPSAWTHAIDSIDTVGVAAKENARFGIK